MPGYSGGIKRYGRWALISVVKFRQDWGLKASTGPRRSFGVADEYAAVLRMVADFDAVAAA